MLKQPMHDTSDDDIAWTFATRRIVESQIKILRELRDIFARAKPSIKYNGKYTNRFMRVPVLSGLDLSKLDSEATQGTREQVVYVIAKLDEIITERQKLGDLCSDLLAEINGAQGLVSIDLSAASHWKFLSVHGRKRGKNCTKRP